MLKELCANISSLPEIAALTERLAQETTERDDSAVSRLRIAPLIGAARPAVIAALVTRQQRPALYITRDVDSALRAVSDLRQWLSPEQALIYPAHDARPYEPILLDTDLVGQRLHALQFLANQRAMPSTQASTSRTKQHIDQSPAPDSRRVHVIVAPISALVQPTPAPQDIEHAMVVIHVNAHISQNVLLKHWIALGYRVVRIVEQPGELARRGGIIDIWPVANEQPFRIEWYGNEIDSLRNFGPQTQRSERRLEWVTIGAPHEIAFWRHKQAAERLKVYDTSTLRPEVLNDWQNILAHLEQGNCQHIWPFWIPFFYGEPDPAQPPPPQPAWSLFAHLLDDTQVLFDDISVLREAASEFHEYAEEQRISLMNVGELPFHMPRPYLLWDELFAQSRARVEIDITNNEPLPDEEHAETDDPFGYFSLAPDPAHPLFAPTELFGGQAERFVGDITTRLQTGEWVVIVTTQVAYVKDLLREAMLDDPMLDAQIEIVLMTDTSTASFSDYPLVFVQGTLDAGWRLSSAKVTLYTDAEIFGLRQRRALTVREQRKQRTRDERTAFLRGLKAGDYVVHIEHGIAVYEGLLRRTTDGVEREYLSLRYAANDRLYVPVDQIDRVTRYLGAGDAAPVLTRLGSSDWERVKRRARAAVRDMADELLKIYARRQTNTGYAFAPDNTWQNELETSFPYKETNDQLSALEEIKQDMEVARPMDRLICGDVGFGKTEVAIRAAFKAVQANKQVAVLVPTTILAQQHYHTFSQRMANFPVKVEMLSRFRSTKEQQAIIQRLARGHIDIVIGTHRLLAKDVYFKSLGLLIIDEEQRFGVRHKERLKQLRAEIDVLTMTATPIPRTLHMTLAGIRDMSVINTPPENRVPIKTYVAPYDEGMVRDAIRREIERGGQVFFLHNRVQSIYHVATRLRELVPEAEIVVAHGQLDERELEQVMLEFVAGMYDVLVCTAIIENGLDVPSTNTIIIDDATNYGLAQLYQLRGRVGRAAQRAYAYLFYQLDKPMSSEAYERLQAIQEATELGAGFRVAMRDLEIRGTGNLLGSEQSGHVSAVGFDLYSRLLEQAVLQLKHRESTDPHQKSDETNRAVLVHEKVLVSPLVTLDLPLTAYLPEDYITDETTRLHVYQRIVEAQTSEDIQRLRREMRDRFGDPPTPAVHLLTWIHMKVLALHAGVRSVVTTSEEFVIRLTFTNSQARERLRRRFGRDKGVQIGTQFVHLNRQSVGDNWIETLKWVLEVLGPSDAQQRPEAPWESSNERAW